MPIGIGPFTIELAVACAAVDGQNPSVTSTRNNPHTPRGGGPRGHTRREKERERAEGRRSGGRGKN